MASIKEMDLNPDTYIGLKLPMKKDNILDFSSTMTIYEQSEYNIKIVPDILLDLINNYSKNVKVN